MKERIIKLIKDFEQPNVEEKTIPVDGKEFTLRYAATSKSFIELGGLINTDREYTVGVIKEIYLSCKDVNVLLPLCTLLQKLEDPRIAELFSNSLSINDKRLFYCSSRALALLSREDLLPDLYKLAISSNDIDCKYHHGLSILCLGDIRAYDLFIEVLTNELHHNVIDKSRYARAVNGVVLREDRKKVRRKVYGPILLTILCQLFDKEFINDVLSSDKSIAFYASWIKYLADNKARMQSINISKVKSRLLYTSYRENLDI